MEILYIPIWFYSNFLFSLTLCNCVVLYIPIWFYSNWIQRDYGKGLKTFTFQSGSIQIDYTYIWSLAWYDFTFQSGSIQMRLSTSHNLPHISLHSTLVSSIGYIFFQISNPFFYFYFNFNTGFFKRLLIRSV